MMDPVPRLEWAIEHVRAFGKDLEQYAEHLDNFDVEQVLIAMQEALAVLKGDGDPLSGFRKLRQDIDDKLYREVKQT